MTETTFGLLPLWPVPAQVRAISTTRSGGVSSGNWGLSGGGVGGLNLGASCGDSDADVARNRQILGSWVPGPPLWLEQVHGIAVFDADLDQASAVSKPPRADASITTRPGVVLAVLTADCLPILVSSVDGQAVGAIHAGWRGLAAGVVEATIKVLTSRCGDRQWVAWLGPAIGPGNFEVGDEVRAAFCDLDHRAQAAFSVGKATGKWYADLYQLATLRLAAAGVTTVLGGGLCTVADHDRFYSYRRDRQTGRMASVIWID
ncbi:MAG: peptidoglycan editing factor PgeF [Quisquiliibacterium sp.]